MTPVARSSRRPPGSAPRRRLQSYGRVPPVATRPVEYGTLGCAFGRLDVVIRNVLLTVYDTAAGALCGLSATSTAPSQVTVNDTGPPVVTAVAWVATPDPPSVVAQPAEGAPPGS